MTDDFNVIVTANTAPSSAGLTNQVWTFDSAQSYVFPAFTDAQSDTFTYTGFACVPAAAGITMTAATRTISMAASGQAAGTYACTITADDTYTNGVGTGTFSIKVNTKPVQTALVAQTLYKGKAGWTYTATACTDPNGGDTVTQTARNFG